MKRLFLFIAIVAFLLPSCFAQPSSEVVEESMSNMKIEVRSSHISVVYELNNSNAAKDLYDQLPLSVEIEDYGTNEKIFYPDPLDTTNTPIAEGGRGVLAYYAPWGDVVLFYDYFSRNSSLYSLGHAISGANDIQNLNGTVEIIKVED